MTVTVAAPLWLRVAMFARTHADTTGVAFLEAGQLARSIEPGRVLAYDHVRDAIQTAVRYGWLRRGSTTRLLYPEAVTFPCGCHPAYHELGTHAPKENRS